MRTAYLILFCLLLLYSADASSQEDKKVKKIDLIDADRMEYNEDLGLDFTRLIGNVVFRHEDILLYCDSAYLYDADNSLDAFSNIHIKVSDSLNIYGDSLRYNGNEKIAEMHHNVRMIDNQITLTTDHLTYNLKEKTGQYYDGGKIVDPENTLTSKKGFYYSEIKDFFFNDSVVLVNINYTIYSDSLIYNTQSEVSRFYGSTEIISDENYIYCEKGWYNTLNDEAEFTRNALMHNNKQKLEGDSIIYNRLSGRGFAYHHVTVTDTIRNSLIKCHYLNFDNKEQYTLATQQAQLIQIEGSDSLFLHADTLMATFDTLTEKVKELYAFHKVKFFRTDMQGMCDSLVYNYADSLIHMYYKPVLWTEDKQISADTVYIQISNDLIDKMHFRTSCFMISSDDSTEGRFNQVKGLNMTCFFTEGELYKIAVYNNAESIYFLREDDGKRIGINSALCTNMEIRIEDRQISEILFLDKPVATLFPEGEITGNDLLLKNFRWMENYRPKNKSDIFIYIP